MVDPDWIQQAAAIPVKDGQICLVRSSNGKRWVIPKGCLEPAKTTGEIALQEAWEEAGLVGVLDPEPLGSYLYSKWGSTCHVVVFRMEVKEIAEEWPERLLRQRTWFKPGQAVSRIAEEGLRDILRSLIRDSRVEAQA